MAKRTLVTLDIKQKIAVLDRLNGNVNKDALASEFGVSRSTISRIGKDESKLRDLFCQGNSSRKRQRSSANDDVDDAVITWFTAARASGVPLNGPMILEKAQQQLGNSDFKANGGWLDRLKGRHQLKFKRIVGESAAADTVAASDWSKDVLPTLVEGFAYCDIYNADETGLFYKALPSGTFAATGDKATGCKVQKERLTGLLFCNADGSDKKLIVIGKSAKPRCFKNKNPPLPYYSSAKAWMNSEIWTQIVLKFDNEMRQQNRNVLLFADNASSHKLQANLTNVKINFLPPNTTSLIQPLDQGIIRAMKVHYRTQIVRKLIAAVDDGKTVKQFEKEINVLDALYMLKRAWFLVAPKTIQNCFRKAGFVTKIGNVVQEDEIQCPESIEREEFLALVEIDTNIDCCGQLSDAEICAQVLQRNEAAVEEEDAESEEEEEDQPRVNALVAQGALDTYKMFCEQNQIEVSNEWFVLQESLLSFRCKNFKQTKISDFFSK